MILIGILHITLSLIAYLGYLFVTFKEFSKGSYLILRISNILYFIGFIIGMMWAKIEWGIYLNLDIKTILSMLLFVPFLAEDLFKTKKRIFLVIGTLLIILNYIIPTLIYTYHSH